MNNFTEKLWEFAQAMPPVNSAQSIRNPLGDRRGVKQPCSLMALKSVDTISIGNKILLELYERGMTDDELEVTLKMRHQTVSACRRGLVKKDLVVPSGDTRPTRSGRKANVWEVTQEGKTKAGMILDRLV
jgi:hypothetical protein